MTVSDFQRGGGKTPPPLVVKGLKVFYWMQLNEKFGPFVINVTNAADKPQGHRRFFTGRVPGSLKYQHFLPFFKIF